MSDQMTWEKFKGIVDQQLAEEGLPQDVALDYIDTSFHHDEVLVGYDPKRNAVSIS